MALSQGMEKGLETMKKNESKGFLKGQRGNDVQESQSKCNINASDIIDEENQQKNKKK